jgi:ethanolamine utilization protein EutK
MKIDAFGLVEVRGLVAAIEAADAMLKTASVRLIRQHQINPGLITLVVEGDLGACRAAVDAGVAAAARLGEVVSRLEIGRPDGDTETMILSLVPPPGGGAGAEPPRKRPRPAPPPAVPDGDGKPPEKPAKPAESAPAESAKPAEPDEPAEPAESDSATDGVAEARAVMFTFIAKSRSGRRWAEIVKYFPEYADYGHVLEEMFEEGILRKKGERYLRNDGARAGDR